ncbi:MAG: hypothetical protein ACI85U_001172 [Candidatus Promineifilaceae bacterium]|jgi:hypothetical protein
MNSANTTLSIILVFALFIAACGEATIPTTVPAPSPTFPSVNSVATKTPPFGVRLLSLDGSIQDIENASFPIFSSFNRKENRLFLSQPLDSGPPEFFILDLDTGERTTFSVNKINGTPIGWIEPEQ